MIILDKTVISTTEPPWTTVLWIKPVEGGVAHYAWLNGKWQILRLMNDHGTPNPNDDTPIDIHEGQLGPDTVGTEQIIDDSVMEEDLNSTVRGKIQKTYHQDDEALHMDYDIAAQQAGFDTVADDEEDDV